MDSGAECKTKTIKILKNKYNYIYGLRVKAGFLKWDLKHKSIKKKIDDCDFIKIKNLRKAKYIENIYIVYIWNNKKDKPQNGWKYVPHISQIRPRISKTYV